MRSISKKQGGSAEPTLFERLRQEHSASYERVVKDPFVIAAGNGSLPRERFVQFLRQTYLLTNGEMKFFSMLLTRVPFPPTSTPKTDAEQILEQLRLCFGEGVGSCLDLVKTIQSTAEEFGLDLFVDGSLPDTDRPEDEGLLGPYQGNTHSFNDWMLVTAGSCSLEEGVFLLLSIEKVWYEVWTFATSQFSAEPPADDYHKALRKMIGVFSSESFGELLTLLENLFAGLQVEPDSALEKRCEQIFKRVLWIEKRFWVS